MIDAHLFRFRMAMSAHLGRELTPEVAALIEGAAFRTPDKAIDPAQFSPREYRGLTFAVESFRQIVGEVHPLHVEHYATTEKHREHIALDPDYEAVAASERAGTMLQCTARRDGALVGQIRMYLATSTHTGTRFAREDVFFLQPEERRGYAAIRFWQFMEDCMRQLGVLEVRTDSKVANDVGRLNEYLGYQHVSNGYVRFLKPTEANNVL